MSKLRFSRFGPRRAGPLVAAIATLALVLIPAASSEPGPQYKDAAGDSGTAGDITAITVANDTSSGQVVFRISGSNLSTSSNSLTMLGIDSDANPSTGDPGSLGADYWFGVDDSSYGFEHWDGSDWVPTSYGTVRVFGGGSSVAISVNKSEIGNTTDFNFWAESADIANKKWDDTPDDGTFNYSLAANGPDIQGVELQTAPSSGPKAGKKFVVSPVGLKLPASGATIPAASAPESYSCKAKLKGRAIKASGTGGCTLAVPKKKTRGLPLSVTVTVTYEGATRSFAYAFKVH
jgi:hypothetical protein